MSCSHETRYLTENGECLCWPEWTELEGENPACVMPWTGRCPACSHGCHELLSDDFTGGMINSIYEEI